MMKALLKAGSISRPVVELLAASSEYSARVLASFRHACNLLTPAGELVALVSPTVGDGPLNVVVEAQFQAIAPDTRAELEGQVLHVGPLAVGLGGATIWEPRADWGALAARRAQIVAHLHELERVALRHAPAGSLLTLDAGEPEQSALPAAPGSGHGFVSSRVRRAAAALLAGWEGDADGLRSGSRELAGLGSGLTPAGDDFLVGLMLWAWVAHSNPLRFCRDLAEAAAPRTTVLSAALMKAAAAGGCSAAWHQLLAALAGPTELDDIVSRLLSHGATSGADTLAGFLWMGTASTAA